MKHILIGVPMGLIVALAIIVGCFELATWLETNSNLTITESRWIVLGILLFLIFVLGWLISYNNREVKND